MDVHRHARHDANREHALLSVGSKVISPPLHTDCLSILHHEPPDFYGSARLSFQEPSDLGGPRIFCLDQRLQSFCGLSILGVHG